jgi:hypothetical protein
MPLHLLCNKNDEQVNTKPFIEALGPRKEMEDTKMEWDENKNLNKHG